MSAKRYPRPQPGDELTTLHFKAIYDALERLELRVANGSGLTLSAGPGGTVIGLAERKGFWIKLTSNSSNAYAWTEQLPQSGGTWVDGYQSGTTSSDPAREVNGLTTPPTLPKIVRAWRGVQSNEVLFGLSTC